MSSLGLLNWQYSPIEEMSRTSRQEEEFNSKFNANISYTPISGFNIDVRYEYQRGNILSSNYFGDSSFYIRDNFNKFTIINPDGSLTYQFPTGGILNTASIVQEAHQLRPTINYNKQLNNFHSLTTIAGAEIRNQINETRNNTAYGYNKATETNNAIIDYTPFYNTLPYGSQRIPNNQFFSKLTRNFISYFANALYDYNQLYQVYVSARTERSNLFGVRSNQKAVPLYAIGFSWLASNCKRFQIPWVSFLKLRLSYGYPGNINYTATGVTTIVRESVGSPMTNQPNARIESTGNPALRWEKNPKNKLWN